MCLIFIFIFIIFFNESGPLSSHHDQLQREGGGLWARPPVQSPDACTSVADDLASNKLHDFLHEPEHWHIHDLLHDAMLHALPSRLVTGIWTKGTQFHNVCFDVHRAPCESHDNLSFAASYQERTSNRFGSHSPQKKSKTMRCVLSEFSQGLPVLG